MTVLECVKCVNQPRVARTLAAIRADIAFTATAHTARTSEAIDRLLHMTITRLSKTDYAVITDTLLSDGSYKQDRACRLSNDVLRSHEQRGHVRIGGLITIQLGPKSLAIVSSLAVGQSAQF